MEEKFKKLHNLIKKSKSAALVGHIRPDGDCIGSCIAMKLALQQLGYKSVDIYIDGPIPSNFSYMPLCDTIITLPSGDADDSHKKYDLLIAIDCADENRLGVFTNLRKHCKSVICIDHHQNTMVEADVMISEPTIPSAGAILYDYFKFALIDITKDIATALYTSVASDTGCFMFSNTTPGAHRITADLIERGINIEEINYYNFRVYESDNIPALIHVLKNIKLFSNKQIAIIHLPYRTIKKLKIDGELRHKFQKYAENLNGVKASATISERERGVYHISLRSHGDINVAMISEHFGGGGHKNAAGFQLKGKYKKVLADVIAGLDRAIGDANGRIN